MLSSSAAGGAYWPIATSCPSLGPSPCIAHRPLTTQCPSSSFLAYPSFSTSLSVPLAFPSIGRGVHGLWRRGGGGGSRGGVTPPPLRCTASLIHHCPRPHTAHTGQPWHTGGTHACDAQGTRAAQGTRHKHHRAHAGHTQRSPGTDLLRQQVIR